MILEDIGINSDIAIGGEQAIKMVQQRYKDIDEETIMVPYRLIFMDYSMPMVDGIQATQGILDTVRNRGLDQNNFDESPYICCLSAYTDQTYVDKAMEVGMHDYMAKPA